MTKASQVRAMRAQVPPVPFHKIARILKMDTHEARRAAATRERPVNRNARRRMVFFGPELNAMLLDIADERDTSVSTIVRDVMRDWVREQKRKKGKAA